MPRITSSGSGVAEASPICYDPTCHSPTLLLVTGAASPLFFTELGLRLQLMPFYFR
jgi:hypothetical protein